MGRVQSIERYFTYLRYAPGVQSMVYTTNWIERLNRHFRRVTRMRPSLPNATAAMTLLGAAAMNFKCYDYPVHSLNQETRLFNWSL